MPWLQISGKTILGKSIIGIRITPNSRPYMYNIIYSLKLDSKSNLLLFCVQNSLLIFRYIFGKWICIMYICIYQKLFNSFLFKNAFFPRKLSCCCFNFILCFGVGNWNNIYSNLGNKIKLEKFLACNNYWFIKKI